MKRRFTFTIWHGLAASLVLHSALAAPFAIYARDTPPDDDPTLVISLQGVESDVQVEQKLLQETKGETKPEEAHVAKAEETPPTPQPPDEHPAETADDSGTLPPPTPQQSEAPKTELSPPAQKAATEGAANNVVGTEQQQNAQVIKVDPDEERDLLNKYVKVLAKKVQGNLVYPDQGRRSGLHGTATVTFAIQSNGQLRLETLKIIESSGQPELDASALKTIRACAPFAPPPEDVTIAIAVAFGHKT